MRQAPIFVIALALAAGAGTQACGRGDRAPGGPAAQTAAGTPPAENTSAAAERQIITLTGCLKRDVQPGTYTLVSVGTAGVLDDTGAAQKQKRENLKRPDSRMRDDAGRTNTEAATPSSQAAVSAATSYQLVPTKDDQREDMRKYENQRVAVRGRLAAEAPVGTSGNANGAPPQNGTVVDSSATNATVAGSAPPLRGFQVESVRKVGDSCTAQ